MTQEEINRLAKRFYPVTEDIYGDDEARFERAAFKHGANYIISSPTDFGLVSMETMFEFAEYTQRKGFSFVYGVGLWCRNLDHYTTPELFQIFKNK